MSRRFRYAIFLSLLFGLFSLRFDELYASEVCAGEVSARFISESLIGWMRRKPMPLAY